MGIKRPPQPGPGEPQHNASFVDLAGYERDEIKSRVYSTAELTAREKSFLVWVADQDPSKYLFCVKQAQAALGLSVKQWPPLRKKLVLRCFLKLTPEIKADGSHFWTMRIFFAPLRASIYDAPNKESKEEIDAPLYNARVIPPKREDRDPAETRVLTQIHTPPPPSRGAGGNVHDSGEEAAQPNEAAVQPVHPTPAADEHLPAPNGGGAVLHVPQGSELMPEKNFESMKEFFDWLGRNGVLEVRVAAQVRKKSNGERGAPMGEGALDKKTGRWNPVGVGAPIRSARAAERAQDLLARLAGMGKRRLELVVAAAKDQQGLSKSILVDDLDAGGARALKTKWRGPGAILETSQGNHQAILILPEAMDKASRKSITDQLVSTLGGDAGATSDGQFHRLPGSVNYKQALAEPFTCRLVEYFTGTGEGVRPVKLAAKPVVRPVSVSASSSRSATGRTMRKIKIQWSTPSDSMSQDAFRLAVEMLAGGASAAAVETALGASEWLRHHDSADWPARTRENAELFRAGKLYGLGWRRSPCITT